ncbi:hypothetical protein ED28_07130 [[Pantoea] beijingensis]|uniref:3-hydroxyacyl-CoA dehydrogenase n=1 Tax=[Pantoea] beijingensis TaxID=1324864 RepID=A0A443IF07_9GAMM|nr:MULTISPECIES: hypothetical protein [Erwiniaceae]RWR02630.1 hypothetical protein ED28_07130 [[Pantoea] beijingensis]
MQLISEEEGAVFFLQIKNCAIVSINTRSKVTKVILGNLSGTPDGIQIDHEKGLIYWTNMGMDYNQRDGTIEVCRLDGTDHQILIGNGLLTTPKQLQLDKKNNLLYWCDREGGKVMRSQCDGSGIEILVDNAKGHCGVVDILEQCVGVTVDTENNKLYWTQKGPAKGNKGRIFCTHMDVAPRKTPVTEKEIDVLLDNLPEPIDLEIDKENHLLYWTDRGSPPQGNTLNTAKITGGSLIGHHIICGGFDEAIGLTLDRKNNCVYVSDLGGGIYRVDIKTGEKERLWHQDSLTGITG